VTASSARGYTISTITDRATPQQRSASRLVSVTRLLGSAHDPVVVFRSSRVRGRPKRASPCVGEAAHELMLLRRAQAPGQTGRRRAERSARATVSDRPPRASRTAVAAPRQRLTTLRDPRNSTDPRRQTRRANRLPVLLSRNHEHPDRAGSHPSSARDPRLSRGLAAAPESPRQHIYVDGGVGGRAHEREHGRISGNIARSAPVRNDFRKRLASLARRF
jgi:hypothetical protein